MSNTGIVLVADGDDPQDAVNRRQLDAAGWQGAYSGATTYAKDALLAGVALVLMVADDEEGSEVYSCALDVDQARRVYDVAERMVELSPVLSKRITSYKQSKRLLDSRTGSF